MARAREAASALSMSAAHKRHVMDLEASLRELERLLDKEQNKARKALRELQQCRGELARSERELKMAQLRVQRPASSCGCCSPLGHGQPRSATAASPGGRATLKKAQDEVERLRAALACQEEDLHRAASEIEVLARALEFRADEVGDDSRDLLYQIGLFQKEAHRLERQLKRTEIERDEARAALDRAEEANEEDRDASMRSEAASVNAAKMQISELLEERQVVLDYLKELTAKSKAQEAQVERLTAEKDEALARCKEALEEEALLRQALEGELLEGGGKDLLTLKERMMSTSDDLHDPNFERLLRETEAELHATAEGDENAKLRAAQRQLQERVRELELELEAEYERSEALEERAAAASARAAKEGEGEGEEGDKPHDNIQIVESKGDSSGGAEKGENERLRGLLNAANKAREFAEREATRLEAENAALKRALAQQSATE